MVTKEKGERERDGGRTLGVKCLSLVVCTYVVVWNPSNLV